MSLTYPKPGASLPVTIVSTDLNSLGSGSWVVTSAIDRDADKPIWAHLFLTVTFGSAPTADGPIYCAKVRGLGDGTYEDASPTGPVVPPNGLVGVWKVRAINTVQTQCIPWVRIDAVDFKLMIGNGASQGFPASGSTIKMVPINMENA